MKKTVVQLVMFKSIYNENLQKYLNKNINFIKRFDLIEINIIDNMSEFEKVNEFKKYNEINIFNKLIYFYLFNKYLILKYGHLKGSILHIQCISGRYVFLLYFFKKTFSKIILTFWGSDLLRANNIKILLLNVLCHYADIITFGTKSFSEIFNKKFYNKYDNKIRIVDFGIQIISEIDEVTECEIKSFIKKYNICDCKKIVAIGYNRSKAHQHIKVINSIINSKVGFDEIFVIFPWTYGEEEVEYREQINNLIKDKYDYVFIDEELTNKEIAALRCLIDILINVEITDVMSSSMLETLYAKNLVITGSWLPYDDIYKEGVSMVCVNSVDEIGDKLKNLLNRQIDEMVLKQNSEIIRKLFNWETCINKWISLYE